MRRPLPLCLLAVASALAATQAPAAAVYLHVRTAAETGQLKVWGSDDGKTYTYMVSSSAYMDALRRGHKPFARYLLKLDYLPRHIRLGTQGQFLGRVEVDVVRAIVDGRARAPMHVKSVGEVRDASAVLAEDRRCATIVQRGQPEPNALELTFQPVPIRRPRPVGPYLYGLYTPPMPTPERVRAVAWYDFSVLQQGDRIPEFVRKVKAINPQHRVILRLTEPNHSCLEYAYHQDSRDAIRYGMIDRVCAGIADLIWGVTLNEEEPGNHLRGLIATHLPPRWVYEYRYHYQRETGKRFAWPSADVKAWLGEKFKRMLTDLYDYAKSRYPNLVVYQWVELAGYGNISGWYPYVKPPLKMDGYMLEWFENTREQLEDSPLGPAARRVEYFANYFQNLVTRDGLTRNRIVSQVWGHEPGRHPLPQIERVKETGANWIYFFWPWAGMPDVPTSLTVGKRPLGAGATYAIQVWPEVKRYIEKDRQANKARE